MKKQLVIKPDVPNVNGHIFPKDVLDKAIADFNKSEVKLGLYGYEKDFSSLPIHKVAFKHGNIFEENGTYYTEVEVLNTPRGEELKNIINDENLMVGLSMIASLNEENIIQDGLEIIYTALIIDPIKGE